MWQTEKAIPVPKEKVLFHKDQKCLFVNDLTA